MKEDFSPRWTARFDAHRPHGFSDLLPIMTAHYRAQEAAEQFLGPYNARQRSSFAYRSPDRELLRQAIPRGRMNEFSYLALLSSLIKFCDETQGKRGLPAAHPSTIHNIQLPRPAFEFPSSSSTGTIIQLEGVKDPIEVKGNLRQPDEIRFIIIRPKLSRLGTASANNWEILFFKTAYGYIPTWVDSDLNPRYSGKLS
jgi:hypothetical protein